MTRRIATILARAGSKGLAGKNTRPFLGEPLLVRTVRQALRTGLFNVVVVSSDSQDFLDLGRSAGAQETVLRPVDLANDTATKPPGIRHAVMECEARGHAAFDTVVDLAVTSPLRGDADISGAIALLEQTNARLVLSGQEAKDNPYFNILEETPTGDYALSKRPDILVSARQAAPRCIALNGAVYVWQRDEILRKDDTVVREGLKVLVMPEDRSIDVDTETDFRVAEFLAQQQSEDGAS